MESQNRRRLSGKGDFKLSIAEDSHIRIKKADCIFHATLKIVSQVWSDYATRSAPGKKPRPLSKRQTKRFLEDFLQLNLTDDNFDKVFIKIDPDETGEVGQQDMVKFILCLSGFPNLANTNTVKRHI